MPVEEIEPLIEARQAARQARELRRSRPHPQGPRRTRHHARGYGVGDQVEAEVIVRRLQVLHEARRDSASSAGLTYERTEIKTSLPGPKARAIIERDAKFVSPSYTRDYPFVIARGEGAVVEDVDGNRFLDCAAGIAVNSTGVSHPDVVEAIIEQAQKFIHMSGTDFYYEPQVRLAEELAAIVPIDGDVRTFFGNSGTEATEAAIKLARYHTKRQGVIAFLGALPRPFAGIAVADREQGHSAPRVRAVHARRVSRAVPGHLPRSTAAADACAERRSSFIRDQILVHLISPDEVAAIVVEPIQGEGGYIVPPKAFLQGLRELTTQHGMVLVVDEVQSGMGRTGKMFASSTSA